MATAGDDGVGVLFAANQAREWDVFVVGVVVVGGVADLFLGVLGELVELPAGEV